jgi:hypothetical protein
MHILCNVGVYQALYPPGWLLGDALELEHLAREMEKTYHVDIFSGWNDSVTIGELFNLAMKHRTSQSMGRPKGHP